MVLTSKKINFIQLDQELGGYGLIFNTNDEENKIIALADNSPVTEEQLITAIEMHEAKPTQEEVTQLNFQEGVSKLKELGFTDEQIKALIGK
jgi:hypothetical protein